MTEVTKDANEPKASSSEPAMSNFGFWGWALLLVGMCLVVGGFIVDGSVETDGYVTGGYLPAPRVAVNNLGLLNTKMMLVVTGVGLMVCGSIFLARKD